MDGNFNRVIILSLLRRWSFEQIPSHLLSYGYKNFITILLIGFDTTMSNTHEGAQKLMKMIGNELRSPNILNLNAKFLATMVTFGYDSFHFFT